VEHFEYAPPDGDQALPQVALKLPVRFRVAHANILSKGRCRMMPLSPKPTTRGRRPAACWNFRDGFGAERLQRRPRLSRLTRSDPIDMRDALTGVARLRAIVDTPRPSLAGAAVMSASAAAGAAEHPFRHLHVCATCPDRVP
jgi:hypothetical protein